MIDVPLTLEELQVIRTALRRYCNDTEGNVGMRRSVRDKIAHITKHYEEHKAEKSKWKSIDTPPTIDDANERGDVLYMRGGWDCLGKWNTIPADATKWCSVK